MSTGPQHHLEAHTPLPPPAAPAPAVDDDARASPAHNAAVDSGIDTGSSSEFDQENSANHALVAQDDSSEASTDEGYADSDASSFLSSILSEVRRGVEIEGRLYPSYGKHDYGMPIDEKELDRNDLQHHKYTLLLHDRLYVAPLPEEKFENDANTRVLDLGTGTGIWAMDMADKYPNAEILGVDIAATQPPFVPPNCIFEIDDVEEDWPYRPAHFDFIHGRDLMTAIRDWPRLIAQAYTHLKPGGWIQLASTIPGALTDDDSIPENSGYVESGRLYFEIAEKMGAPLDAPRSWAAQMKDAGFVNVQDEIYKLPMGTWPRSKRLRTIGKLEQIMILEGGFEAYMLRGYTQVLGGKAEDLQIILALAKREVRDPNVHTYVQFHITYAQKPE